MLKYLEIADKMEAWIIEKDLSQGEKLPKLAELMELYGVSKSTIV
ncbi:MAG TPA: GntR family transcriptional regulator, partial [Lactobacillus sp.]|nr:GntR family transcriptional regulator [Lactobacillus sp.]